MEQNDTFVPLFEKGGYLLLRIKTLAPKLKVGSIFAHSPCFIVSFNYSNPSVYEQLVYEFLLMQDAQINTCFSIYDPIFAYTSSFLSQTDRCYLRLFSGSNGKLIFVL
jgi:hypothetical protein